MIAYQVAPITIAVLWMAIPPAMAQESSIAKPVYRVMNLLQRPALRTELRLNAVQIEDLIALEVDRQTVYRAFGELQASPGERRKAFQELKGHEGAFETKALAILLPAQRARLEQILLQDAVGAFSPTGGVTHPKLARRLELKEPQLEVVRQKAIVADKEFKERLKELQAEIDKARDAARSKVLAELTPEQRKMYEEFIGTPFDLNQSEGR